MINEIERAIKLLGDALCGVSLDVGEVNGVIKGLSKYVCLNDHRKMTIDDFNYVIENTVSSIKPCTQLCRERGFTYNTFYKNVKNNEEWNSRYLEAKREQANLIIEEVFNMYEEVNNQLYDKVDHGDAIEARAKNALVAFAKVKQDGLFKIAGFFQPQKYGNQIKVDHSGEVSRTIRIPSLKAEGSPSEVIDKVQG